MSEISRAQVIAYLQENPDVLEEVSLPGMDRGKGVVDFQSAMLNRLKADKSTAQKLQRELIDTVRANMSNYNRIQTAILVALEADSFEEFVQTVTQDFPVLLDVDVVNIIVESSSREVPFINQAGIRFARPGTVERILGQGHAL